MGERQNSGTGGGGSTKQVDQHADEHIENGTHTHRTPKWTRRPQILNLSIFVSVEMRNDLWLVLDVLKC